jgi:hypothetical protein
VDAQTRPMTSFNSFIISALRRSTVNSGRATPPTQLFVKNIKTKDLDGAILLRISF